MPHLHNQSARDALLFWFNSAFRDTQEPIKGLSSLADGTILLDSLKAVDPDFVDYTEDRTDATRNLLAVRKGLVTSFHRDSYDHLEAQATKVDIHAIPDRFDQNEIAELVTLLMCLSVTGPKQEEYVQHINGLSTLNPDAFKVIGALAGTRMSGPADPEAEAEDDDATGPRHDSAATQDEPTSDKDRILELEASITRSHHDLEKAKRDHAETITRLEQLRIHHDELQDEFGQLQSDNMLLRESETRGTVDAQQILDLKRRIEEQDTTITNLEEKVLALEDERHKLTVEQNPLKEKAERARVLEDEVQELRYHNAELEKKSNAAENYKKKIMQQRDLQVEVSGLRTINEQLHQKMDTQENMLRELPRLQEVEGRFHNMLQSYETQISDLTDHKKSLEHYIRDTDRKLELFEEQRSHDEKYINEMREQIATGQPEGADGGDSNGNSLSLEQELEGGDGEATVPMSLELSRLKAENQMLRVNMASATEATHLRAELDTTERTKTTLQSKNNELFEQHAIAQEQIKAMLNNMTGEGFVQATKICERTGKLDLLTTTYYSSVAFANLRREKDDSARALTRATQRIEELEACVSDRDREILSARTDCERGPKEHKGPKVANTSDASVAVIEKDSLSALEELKATDQLVAASARNELAIVQQKYSEIQTEHTAQQSELVKAFLARDKLTTELEEAHDAQEKTQNKTMSEKEEKLKLKFKQTKEALDKEKQENYNLRRSLKSFQDGTAAAAETATKDELIMNLKHENKMISTAWYDLNSRLQSNHVVLQRRQDQPKAWLNKQRYMVNATPRR